MDLLGKLKSFNEKIGDERYHENFEFRNDDVLEDFLDANDVEEDDIEKILEGLEEFASADNSGGIFALWKTNHSNDETPIVWFGSEGRQEVIACNVPDFITLLTSGRSFDMNDDEINVDLSVLTLFRNWVKEELSLPILKDNNHRKEIEKKAGDKYQNAFDKWLSENGADNLVE